MQMRRFLDLMRPFTLLAPAVGFLAGSVMAANGLPPVRSLAGALAAMLLNAAANVINQCFDIEVDRINKPERPLPSGRISMPSAVRLGVILYGASLSLAYLVAPRLLAIFVSTAILTVLYSAPPVRLRRHALSASLALGIGRGCLLIVAGWGAVAPFWHPAPWFVGMVCGLYIFGAGNTKDFADVDGDRLHGIQTLPVLFGARRAAWAVWPFLIVPFLLIPVGIVWGWIPWSGVFLTPLGIWGGYIGWLMLRHPEMLTIESNHVSWKHMYLLLIAMQVGFAGIFVL